MSSEINVNEMLRERASLKISLIGVGNAGNQLLNKAQKAGYDVFAINSSEKDLNNAVTSDQLPSFVIGHEARGAGKVRSVAVNLFKETGNNLFTSIPYFTEMCERSDVIIVAGATAGGTGSGVCPPLINLLKNVYPTKIIIYIGIIPRLTDSVNAQENSIACLNEIFALKIPYILADLNYYTGVANDLAYDKIQNYIIDCLDTIAGKYLNMSSFGMIDENDMRMVIGEPGYMSLYFVNKVTQQMLDRESMQSMMIKQVKHNPAAEMQRDKIIKNMAAIFNVSEDITDSSRSGDYEELESVIGRPLSTYENYAITNGTEGQMIIILSGQTDPMNRVDKMIQISKTALEQAKMRKDFTSAMQDAVNSSLTQNRNLPGLEDTSSDEKKATVADFFKNL